jgi:hypothetical protein
MPGSDDYPEITRREIFVVIIARMGLGVVLEAVLTCLLEMEVHATHILKYHRHCGHGTHLLACQPEIASCNFTLQLYFTLLCIPFPGWAKKCRCLRVCPVFTPRPSLPNRMSSQIL